MNEREFRRYTAALRSLLNKRIATLFRSKNPRELHKAGRYVLASGGKRIRSILLLLATESVRGRVGDALDAGVAVELMHNFTLIHDDVMDHAKTRRGRPTVHVRWDLNQAILVGDVMVGFAYDILLRAPRENAQQISRLFTKGLINVCEGQALDLTLGSARHATVKDYVEMIDKKTGSLIVLSSELGGVVGGGTAKQVRALREYGRYLGRAFQLQDDLLDVVADEKRLGKAIGGDIMEGKRTFLYITTMERASNRDRRFLTKAFNHQSVQGRALVHKVQSLYHKYESIEKTRAMIEQYTAKALVKLHDLPPSRSRDMLHHLARVLASRHA